MLAGGADRYIGGVVECDKRARDAVRYIGGVVECDKRARDA